MWTTQSTPRVESTSKAPQCAKRWQMPLRTAITKLSEANIPLNARLGDIQYAPRNGRNLPIPGGIGTAGMFSMIITSLDPEKG